MRYLVLVVFTFSAMLACVESRPAPTAAADLSLPPAFTAALAAGRIDLARAEVDKLQAAGQIGAALRGRAWIGKRIHDSKEVRAVATDPHAALLAESAEAQNELARAMLWTVGLVEALPTLEAVCADQRLPAASRDRQDACSMAALARLAKDKPRTVDGDQRAVVDLLPKVPLPIVLASVNGKPPEPFIIDTGAATSVLSKSYCDRAGIAYLADKPHLASSPGGDVQLFPALVDEIKLGGVVVKNWTANVLEFPKELRVGGILAPQDTLMGMVVELDGREFKLRLYRDLDGKSWADLVGEPVHLQHLFWTDGNVYVLGKVNELSGWFLFDSGAGASQVVPEAAKKLGHPPDEKAATKSVTAGEQAKVFQTFDANLAIGDAPAFREQIFVVDEPEKDEVQRVGSIGFPWMMTRRVALSSHGHVVIFTERAR
jgi:predicted aspartyl protease